MIGALIANSVANAGTIAQQVSDAVTTAQNTAAAQLLATASDAARGAVTSFEKDFYERKIFDPYLHFTSKEDQDAYREREAERKAALDRERAKGTPEGDLRALNLSIAQTEDAGAHGAAASTTYQPMLDGMRSARANLAQQMSSQAKSADQEIADAATGDTKNVAASTTVSPDLIASFRAAGVAVAEQNTEGHGVPARDTASAARGLT